MMPETILSMTLPELQEWCVKQNEPPFRARQMLSWIYDKNVTSFDAMTDLPVKFRERASRNMEILAADLARKLDSRDGTVKYLLKLRDGYHIETVHIPHERHYTLCLSSQVGCALKCKFCATGNMGILRNLTPGEILTQVLMALRESENTRKGNIVFMGMGEPLMNTGNVLKAIEIMTAPWGLGWSPSRITLSTAGIIPEIQRFGAARTGVHLAISLNAADDRTRTRLMPINRKYPLVPLIQAINEYPLRSRQEKITIEYVLIRGLNSSPDDARKLSRSLPKTRCKINLITVNPAGSPRFQPPEKEDVLAFQQVLSGAGFLVRIRESHGSDIAAACGQLAGTQTA